MLKLLIIITILCFAWLIWKNLTPRKGDRCSWTPNCVSSRDTREHFFIEPFPIQENGIEKLASIIQEMERARILRKTEDYLHAEFTSKLFRFKDDVEFSVDKDKGTIQVRSASRIGYGDMGVNRKRIEAIRKKWTQR